MKKLILLFLLIPVLCFGDMNPYIAGSTVSGCDTGTSEISQTTNSAYVESRSPTSPALAQKITVLTEVTLYSIKIYAQNFDTTIIDLRIGTNADQDTYTEEIRGTFTGTSGQWIEFVSADNPTLTTGTWYIGLRVISGTDTSGWFMGSSASAYSGGGKMVGGGGTTDWEVQFESSTDDLAFEVLKCD